MHSCRLDIYIYIYVYIYIYACVGLIMDEERDAVIGGGVSQAGELLLGSLRETARQRSVRAAGEDVGIVQAALGRRSSALGAVAQVIQETFRNPVQDLIW